MKKIIIILAVIISVISGVYLTLGKQNDSNKSNVGIRKMVYIAMGDSVAAGQGLPYPSDTSACDRSDESYPNLVASTLKIDLKNLACSGATLSNGILGIQNVNKLDIVPQATQLESYKNPALISITVGANDVNWLSVLSKCYIAGCGTTADSDQATEQRNQVGINLKKVLDMFKNQPRVVVSGYYQLMPTEQLDCASLNGINNDERLWLRSQVDDLNTTIQNTVQNYPYVTFAKPEFNGHELCTDESWVQSLRDKAPYHPTSAGQQAIALAVIAAYKANL